MRYLSTLLAVHDMERALKFYREVFGLEIVNDFGANKELSGGISLQTHDTWRGFIENKEITYGGNDAELYFEEDDMDGLLKRLSGMEIELVHGLKEHSWGQRVIRIYDQDRHIIEIGENMAVVTRRFLDSGMTVEQTAERMDVPVSYVLGCIK